MDPGRAGPTTWLPDPRRATLTAPSTCWPKAAKGGMLPALRGGPGDLGPDREGSRAGAPVFGGSDVIATEMEEVVDLVMGALCCTDWPGWHRGAGWRRGAAPP